MAFDMDAWKAKVQERLQGWKGRMQQVGVPSLYGFLTALTLWPLVEAAQGGQLTPVLLALGGLAGGIGAELVADQVVRWKDGAAGLDEADVAVWVAEQAGSNKAIRDALDAVLQRLETVPQARLGLEIPEQVWFAEELRQELARLGNLARYEALLEGSGAIIQGNHAQAAGERGLVGGATQTGQFTTGDHNILATGPVVIADKGATVIIGELPVTMTAVERESALGRYLQHVISRNRYLQLQGIRSGGRLVNIELDRIYLTLRATRQREVKVEESWLAEQARLAPGEWRRLSVAGTATETATVSIDEALASARRLVVLGDPGSGKTTLLRHLALLYARDLAEGTRRVLTELGLEEAASLPILLPFRQVGAFLQAHRPANDGTEGHGLLLDFLLQSLQGERISLPTEFFDSWLQQGRATLLFDGLDEVADPVLRQRVSRLVEAFTCAYPHCRYVVTSRIVGYAGAARLSEGYDTTTVRDFTMADVEQFLTNWHRLVAIGQMGIGPSSEVYAAEQTRQLLAAIVANERIRELAINPLMLTVIAMVHRDRVQLPDRRAELYAEAVDVLLGKWDEAKVVVDTPVLDGKPFDTGDKRLILQGLALTMHEHQQKEIEFEPLRNYLNGSFHAVLGETRASERAAERFLQVVEERTGLLVARGEGVYAFSHLTFQEYLAALAVAARDDYVAYTLLRAAEPWWREVILLEVGDLSTRSRERTSRLVQAIADLREEPEPYHNLVLASDCLRDAGTNRVESETAAFVQQRLRQQLEAKPAAWMRFLPKRISTRQWVGRRSVAMAALARAGSGYWALPYGEPEWVQIPAGAFWMGSDPDVDGFSTEYEQPIHQVSLPAYAIARVPITNAQYYIFVKSTGREAPSHWVDDRPPRGYESHPVVRVNWDDALAYCTWLSEVTGKRVMLPSEAEWEKAARGNSDRRIYPWGDTFDPFKCNCSELALHDTTPAGIFIEGASPYGCLDMSGNVWEWTASLWGSDPFEPAFRYPYDPSDGRENLRAPAEVVRVLRGGSFYCDEFGVRCAARFRGLPGYGYNGFGFRVVASPSTSGL